MSNLYEQFEDLVEEAITEGFESGLTMFMEGIESDLRNLAMIEEAGGIENVVESVVTEQNTLKRLLRR
jgi:hypothetical protein